MNQKTISLFIKRAFKKDGVPASMLEPKWDKMWFHLFRREFESCNRNTIIMSTLWCGVEQILIRRKLLDEKPERASERAMREASEIEKDFRDAIADNRKQSLDTSHDSRLRKAYADDATQMQKVFDLYLGGNLVQAHKLAGELDTIVREQLPCRAWDLMSDAVVAHRTRTAKTVAQELVKHRKS